MVVVVLLLLLLQLMLAAAAADDDAGAASPCTFPRMCANGTVGEQMMSIRLCYVSLPLSMVHAGSVDFAGLCW